jgi:hypothetical protein
MLLYHAQNRSIRLSPSLLSANFAMLGADASAGWRGVATASTSM